MQGKSKTNVFAKIAIALLAFAVILSPLLFSLGVAFMATPVYDNSFLGELGEKYDRLCSVEDKKLVVVGGSSVAFGLDSALMEKELEMEVVNFGLYASLGTKIMLDLSREGINEGDVVVIAPELSDQTLSLYFNSETTLQALDGNFDMLKSIDRDNYGSLVGGIWKFAGEKLRYLSSGEKPENTGAYKKEYFNEYGDNVYDRPYNTMTLINRSIMLDYRTDFTDGVTTEYEEFINYINEYVLYCECLGAKVYFSFAPMNKAAFTEENTDEVTEDFYENLCASLRCPVISNVHDYIMDEGYFFDSEFHLNNSGVTVRTVNLIDDIKRELGITTLTMKKEDLPAPSGYAPTDFEEGDEENLYYELTLSKNGKGEDVYIVTGLNSEGKGRVSLTIPNNVDGTPVVGIGEYALQGSEVRTLTLGDNVSSISSCAFGGAKSLTRVYVTKADPAAISIPNLSSDSGLATKDANPNLTIFVPEESLTSYKTDYFWGDYNDLLAGYSTQGE